MWRILNCFEKFLPFVSAVTGWVSVSAFASVVCVPGDTLSSKVELKICGITLGIKKYESIFKEN